MESCFAARYLSVAVVFACSLVAGAAAVDPKQLYAQSSDAMYNLDFNTAQRGYEALTREYPDNPDYWNAVASSIWLKITFDQQKLNLESFSGRSTFGTKESHEKLNPEDEKRLRDTINIAVTKADALLRRIPTTYTPSTPKEFQQRRWRALKVRSNVLTRRPSATPKRRRLCINRC